MEPQNQNQTQSASPSSTTTLSNPFLVPIAIVIAGVLIAGAIFYSKSGTPQVSNEQKNLTEMQKKGLEKLPAVTSKDHILGNPNTDLVIVEYSDLECPFCKSFHETTQKVMSTYGKAGSVSLVFRHFPLYKDKHPKALEEAEAAECAAELGGESSFWKFVDEVFRVTPSNNGLDLTQLPKIATVAGVDVNKFNTCLSSNKYEEFVTKSFEEAVTVGSTGTPYVIVVAKNGISTAKQQELINNFTKEIQKSQPGAVLPPDFFVFSADGKKMAWSGSLPMSLIQIILDTLLKK